MARATLLLLMMGGCVTSAGVAGRDSTAGVVQAAFDTGEVGFEATYLRGVLDGNAQHALRGEISLGKAIERPGTVLLPRLSIGAERAWGAARDTTAPVGAGVRVLFPVGDLKAICVTPRFSYHLARDLDVRAAEWMLTVGYGFVPGPIADGVADLVKP
jgi:hypothetical protein